MLSTHATNSRAKERRNAPEGHDAPFYLHGHEPGGAGFEGDVTRHLYNKPASISKTSMKGRTSLKKKALKR